MKKQYIQPEIETYPITALTVLCTTGENAGLNGDGDGNDPWPYGRAPKF